MRSDYVLYGLGLIALGLIVWYSLSHMPRRHDKKDDE